MDSFITFGKFKWKYKYIFFSVVSLLINDIAFGLNYYYVFKGINLIDLFNLDNVPKSESVSYSNKSEKHEFFKQHFFIRLILCYFGTLILSIIFYKLEIMESYSVRTRSQIYNTDNNVSRLLHTLKLASLIYLWFIEDRLSEKLRNILIHIDFWMLELIFLTYFSQKYLGIEIYKHQIIAMRLTIIPCILKIVTIILSFYDRNKIEENFDNFKRKDGLLEILYVPYPWLLPIGIIFYLIIEYLKAYITVNIKWYMDIRYISPNKILMTYGFFGTLIYTIFCVITTFIRCGNSYKDIYDYICETKDQNNLKYFANFKVYYANFISKNLLPEIITVTFGILGFFFYKYFSLMILKNLTPIHLVFSLPLYYIVRKVILSISIIINKEYSFSKYETFKIKFIIDIILDFICLLGYLIYLEVIKLNFYGLNYNLNENIIIRADNELPSGNLINEKDTDTTYDNENEKEKENDIHSIYYSSE